MLNRNYFQVYDQSQALKEHEKIILISTYIILMSDSKAPKIEPNKLKEYETKQSTYSMVPRLPMRSIILSPSGLGKTILIQNMILKIYKKCFSRIYIFSPSINVDSTWTPVKDYIQHDMKVQHTEK